MERIIDKKLNEETLKKYGFETTETAYIYRLNNGLLGVSVDRFSGIVSDKMSWNDEWLTECPLLKMKDDGILEEIEIVKKENK